MFRRSPSTTRRAGLPGTTTRAAVMAAAGLAMAAGTPTFAGDTASTFSYQGLLELGGSAVDSEVTVAFRLFDSASGGTQQGGTNVQTLTPDDGLFTAALDFGAAPFASNQLRWLEVEVDGQILGRQLLQAAPFSLNTRGVNVATNGNVGLGTSPDSDRLSIFGTASVTGNLTGGGLDITGFSRFQDNIGIDSNVDPTISLTVGGGVRARAGGPGPSGTANNGYSFVANSGGDNDSGMFSTADGQVGLWTDNVPRISIRDGGRIGLNSPGFAGFSTIVRQVGNDNIVFFVEDSTQNGVFQVNANGNAFVSNDLFVSDQIIMGTGGFGNVGLNINLPLDFGLNLQQGDAGKPGGGSWANTSDVRLKKNIAPLEGSLDTLLALRGVTFEYKDAKAIGELDGTRTGFIAQDVERVMPDWVWDASDGYKRVTIRGFEAMAVEAIRELDQNNDELQAENDDLRDRIERLEMMVEELVTGR
jgi:hypothetical protein